MGAICSSCCGQDDNIYETDENDKTNLLGNPVGEPSSRSASQSITNRPSTNGVTDQQDKLNRILQKTANSYIDVPALSSSVDTSTNKPKDYDAIMRAHLGKMHKTEKSYLLEDTPNLTAVLSEDPHIESDKKLMKDTGTSVLAALKSMQIQNSESLVIPFALPKPSN